MLSISTINVKQLISGIEIPMFLVFFSNLLGSPISANFVIYRTCYVIMKRNESECAQLGINTSENATQVLEKEVQEVSNYISIILTYCTMIIPCVLCLFIGTYSDKIGRRKLLIISLTGVTIHQIIGLCVALLPDLSPWYLSLQVIPIMLSGGLPAFFTIGFCYLCDVSTVENRSMRLGFLEGVTGCGAIFGLFLSTYVFDWIGYKGSFTLCTILLLIALVFTVFIVEESIVIDNTENNKVKFFTLVHIKEMWHTTFKPRDGYTRTVLLGCLGAIVCLTIAASCDTTEDLYFRSKFHWNIEKLTNFQSVRSIIIIGSMCGLIYVLHKLLKISESMLVIIGLLTFSLGTGITAFAEHDWEIYTAAVIQIPACLVSVMIRSLITRIITQEETGKIFSFCISVESICSLFAGPIYTILYTETIDVFPGAFYLIPIALYIGISSFFVYVIFLLKLPNSVTFLEDEEKNPKNGNNDIAMATTTTEQEKTLRF